MKPYADAPGRRARQILADLLLVAWVVAWVWVGVQVHDGTSALAGPGRQTAESATSLASGLADAGSRLDGVPLVGDGIAAPFEQASAASERIADAGRAQERAVERLAFWLGVTTAAVPVLVLGAVYLPRRWRFAREAAAGARFVDAAQDLDLFALRALAHQPMHVLGRISDDPAGAWRRGERDVVRALAEVELREVGLRVPPVQA